MTAATAGPLAVYGRAVLNMVPFMTNYFNSAGGANGRPIEIKTYVNNGETADAVRAAESAVIQDGFNILTGYFSSAQSAAIQQSLERLNVLFIDPDAVADGLTGATCNRLYFRTVPSVSMAMNTLASGVRRLGIKTWSALCPDYAFGHDSYDAFKRLVEPTGATVKPGLFPPLTTPDFGSYITQLLSEESEGLFTCVVGSDAVTFLNQASQYGLMDEFQAVVGFNTVDVLGFDAIGDAGLGLYGVPGYDPTLNNERNGRFVEAFKAQFGREPFYIEANTFVAFEMLLAAIAESGSTETDVLAEKRTGFSTDTILGQVQFRAEDHQAQRPNWFGQIVRNEETGGIKWNITPRSTRTRSPPRFRPTAVSIHYMMIPKFDIKGDTATCRVHFQYRAIGIVNGRVSIRNSSGAYDVDYVRSGADWLIKRRITSFFAESKEVFYGWYPSVADLNEPWPYGEERYVDRRV
ncbi:MAG: ABC transporter substrate-binding protein [Micromonosporaceae bacterium]|nr:ABC transporter substrate-binding protein [Micromonosporaceae bacterium]